MNLRRMRAFGLLLVAALVSALECRAQPATGLLFRRVTLGDATYRYEVYIPPAWHKQKKWPVILFLHGAGHRGEYPSGATESVLGRRFQSYQEQARAIVVFPRCRTNGWWSSPDMEAMVLAALEQTMREFNGDRRRVYLTGLSMGGYGAWFLAARHPRTFAAIVPVCGGIRTPSTIPIPPASTAPDPFLDVARRVGNVPVWVFHGSADEVIDVSESRRMVEALRSTGGRVRYTEYAGVGHNSWDRAYAEPDFFRWLFSQRLRSRPAR